MRAAISQPSDVSAHEAVALHQRFIDRYRELHDQLRRHIISFETWSRDLAVLADQIRAAPFAEGLRTIAPRGGNEVTVAHLYDTDCLLTSDGGGLKDGWCQNTACGGPRTPQFYWEFLISGSHGWGCVVCRHTTCVG